VIDLSSSGHQPMTSVDGRLVLTFNGEIYNYRELRLELEGLGCAFRGASDTEVLLQAWAMWGEECLPRLQGMFAFAVWDTKQERLTCVRDAFGIKPLFYAKSSEGFYFASEIHALRELVDKPTNMNSAVMVEYLIHGRYDLSTETFLDGYQRLAAGHVLRIDAYGGQLQAHCERWWWPSLDEDRHLSFDDAVTGVRERFLENVRMHLRSDVPLGVALSGGVDSSSIACAIRHVEPDVPISTFSFVAPGSLINEEAWIDIVNRHIHAVPNKVSVSPEGLSDDLDSMILAQGEPFLSTSIYAQYRVYQAAREVGVTVMLDGQGADELLAGYHGYPSARFRSLLRNGQVADWMRLLRGWSSFPGRSMSDGLQHSVEALAPRRLLPYLRRMSGRDQIPSWIDQSVYPNLVNHSLSQMHPSRGEGQRFLAARLRESLTEGELGVLLRHGDRNSMHWSIESRVPFLTTSFAQFVLRLPEQYLLAPHGETKHVFRAAMRGIVPNVILDRRDKIGFDTAEFDMLRPLRPRVAEWLEGLESIPFVDSAIARKYVEDALSGQRPFTSQVWRLINASRWVQLNNV